MDSNKFDATTKDRSTMYRIVGIVMVIAIVVIVALALAGVGGPGLFTERAAFFGLGFGLLVLVVAVGYILFTLRALIVQLRRDHAAVQSALEDMRSASGTSRREPAYAPAPPMPTPVTREPARGPAPVATATRREPTPAMPTLGPARSEHAKGVRGQPAIEIEGIGTRFAERLEKEGILTIGDLRAANPEPIAKALATHPTTVRQWQAMGDLMEVHGIGKQYSELLVRAGVKSVAQLAKSDPEALWKKIEEVNESRQVRIQGGHVGENSCAEWIKAAQELQESDPVE